MTSESIKRLPTRADQEVEVSFRLLTLMQEMRSACLSVTQPAESVAPVHPRSLTYFGSPRGDDDDQAFAFAAARNRFVAAPLVPKAP